jgi:hypothetical protein
MNAALPHPALDFRGREAEPDVSVILAQKLVIMLREVHHEELPSRLQHTNGFGKRQLGVV